MLNIKNNINNNLIITDTIKTNEFNINNYIHYKYIYQGILTDFDCYKITKSDEGMSGSTRYYIKNVYYLNNMVLLHISNMLPYKVYLSLLNDIENQNINTCIKQYDSNIYHLLFNNMKLYNDIYIESFNDNYYKSSLYLSKELYNTAYIYYMNFSLSMQFFEEYSKSPELYDELYAKYYPEILKIALLNKYFILLNFDNRFDIYTYDSINKIIYTCNIENYKIYKYDINNVFILDDILNPDVNVSAIETITIDYKPIRIFYTNKLNYLIKENNKFKLFNDMYELTFDNYMAIEEYNNYIYLLIDYELYLIDTEYNYIKIATITDKIPELTDPLHIEYNYNLNIQYSMISKNDDYIFIIIQYYKQSTHSSFSKDDIELQYINVSSRVYKLKMDNNINKFEIKNGRLKIVKKMK